MTKENRKQFKQEIKEILLKTESNYICDNIYEDDYGVHIVLKHRGLSQDYYLDINVSMKRVKQYYKFHDVIYECGLYFMDELKLSLDIINWWYK